jgi:hypothetical protein
MHYSAPDRGDWWESKGPVYGGFPPSHLVLNVIARLVAAG